MTTNTKLADLPDAWRATSKDAGSTPVAATLNVCAAELEAALSQQSPSYDALNIIALSVAAALERAGVTECDDPGEAIDVLVQGYERTIARLSDALNAESGPTFMGEPELPQQQPSDAGVPVAYLDLGSGGYMDVGTDLTDEQLALLPKGRHMLAIIGTYGVDGYVAAPDQRAAQAEQQGAGDARAQFEAWAAGRGWKLSPYQNNCGIVVSEKYGHPGVQRCWEAWQAALAARQPVGQERAAMWVEFAENGNIRFWTKDQDRALEEAFLHARPLTAFYTSPPAQVDLAAIRRELSDALDLLDNATAEGDEDANRIGLAELAITRVVEAIDQQAGKGVRHG